MNWNWKLIAAGVAALAYIAWKAGGISPKQLERAMRNNVAIAAAVAAVVYFGWDFVAGRTRLPAPNYAEDVLPPTEMAQQPQGGNQVGAWGASAPVPQHRTGIAGPNGLETTIPLGC